MCFLHDTVFYDFLSYADFLLFFFVFFSKLTVSKLLLGILGIWVPNSLDPEQTRQNVEPVPAQNILQRLSADDTSRQYNTSTKLITYLISTRSHAVGNVFANSIKLFFR